MKKEESNMMDLGKVPPQAIDHEVAILGSLMLESDVFYRVDSMLKEDVFYKDEHRLIYRAIKVIISEGKNPDMLSVTHQLKKSWDLEKVGGSFYITELTNKVVGSSNIEVYCGIIVEKYIFRELIRITDEYNNKSFNDGSDCFDLQEKLNQEVQSITDFLMNSSENIPENMVKRIHEGMRSGIEGSVFYPQWDPLAEIVSYKKGCVYLVGARPGHGKSVFACNEARHFSRSGLVVYFSLEMTAEELAIRIISDLGSITNKRLQNYQIFEDEQESLNHALIEYEGLKLIIIDKPKLSVNEIEIQAKKIMMKYGEIGMIVIDHFHLIKLRGKEKLQSLTENSSDLKAVAKRLNCVVLNLFQLNREMDRRDNKKPKLSDLREVGEQDADVVIFLVRPELWGDGDQSNVIKVYVEKNRNGMVGECDLLFLGNYQRIVDENNQEVKNYRNISEPLNPIL